jgi:hypothetical protein
MLWVFVPPRVTSAAFYKSNGLSIMTDVGYGYLPLGVVELIDAILTVLDC